MHISMAALLCKKRIAHSVVMVGLLTRPKSAGYCECLCQRKELQNNDELRAASHSLLLSKISGGTENDNRRVLLELERLAASQLLANRTLANALFFSSRCQSFGSTPPCTEAWRRSDDSWCHGGVAGTYGWLGSIAAVCSGFGLDKVTRESENWMVAERARE